MKTFHNTDASAASKNVSDLVIWGNGDMFKLLSKASSQKEGWMKSTKAMQIPGVGCVVQVTTQQKCYSPDPDNPNYVVSDAVTFVPGVQISEEKDNEGKVVSRHLVQIPATNLAPDPGN